MWHLETALCNNLTTDEKVELWNIVAEKGCYSERLMTLDDVIDEACNDPKALIEIIIEFTRGVDPQSDYYYWDEIYGLMNCNVHDFFESHADIVCFWLNSECWIDSDGEFKCSLFVPYYIECDEIIAAFKEDLEAEGPAPE